MPATTSSAAPFRSGAVRRAVLAPEVERYLDRRHVDLVVTDQIEALRVRVSAGLDVLQRRLEAGASAAREIVGRWTIVACWLVIGAVASWLSTRQWPCLAGLLAALACLAPVSRALGDLRQARRLTRKYEVDLEGFEETAELLDFAARLLAEARAIGVALPEEG